MGLFSNTYKYFAYSGSTALFAEDDRKDTVKTLMLQATLGSETTLSEAIKLGLQTNMYARVRSMIRYANKPGGYVRGLPETSQTTLNVDEADVIDAIEAEVGEPIIIHTLRWGPYNEGFFIARAIHDTYLNPTYFPWPSGDPADDTYRIDETAAIPVVNPDTTTYYMAESYPDYIRIGTSYDYQVTFRYTNNLSVASTWNVAATYDLDAYVAPTWIMVEYFLASDPEDLKYWIYEVGSGANPDLEEDIASDSLNMFYLPVAILMHDKVWFDEQPDEQLELTTKRLLKDLTLDAYEVKEEYLLQKAEDDASGDTAKNNAVVWDFFIHFGVPIHSQIRGSREYIWNFLRFLESNGQWTSFEDYQAFLVSGGEQPSSWLHVQEGELTGFYALYGWSYVYSVTHPGVFDPVGVAQPLLPRRMYSKVYKFGDSDYSEGIEQVHGVGTPVATSTAGGAFHDYAVFTRQNEPVLGVDSYTQVLIMAPSMFYVVNTSETGDARLRYVDVELFPEDPEEESEFRYPVHIGSLRATATMHREEMLQDALTATVYLVEKVKVKWYQSGFWTWLIIIIVVVIVILTWHYELLPKLAVLAAAATGVTALGLYVVYFILSFAIGYLISFAGSLIGGTWGQIFVIVASLVAFGGASGLKNPFSAWGNSFNALTQAPGWGTAFSFINATTPYMQFAMGIYTKHETNKLESEMRDFTKNAREKQQELEDAWNNLDSPGWLDPMDLVRVFTNNYIESPQSFYARTLNANPGLLGYDLVNNFTEIALALPDDLNSSNMIESMFEDFAKQRGVT